MGFGFVYAFGRRSPPNLISLWGSNHFTLPGRPFPTRDRWLGTNQRVAVDWSRLWKTALPCALRRRILRSAGAVGWLTGLAADRVLVWIEVDLPHVVITRPARALS